MGAALGALLAMLLGEPATAEPSIVPIADDATPAEPPAPPSDEAAGDRRPSVTTSPPS
jgi:hypothetical protein